MRTKKTIKTTGTTTMSRDNASAPAAATTPAPNGAATAIWDALTATPGATVATLARSASVSHTTAAKALAALEAEGKATRTRGQRNGARREPDTWQPVNNSEDPATTAANNEAGPTQEPREEPGEPAPTDAIPDGQEPAGDPTVDGDSEPNADDQSPDGQEPASEADAEAEPEQPDPAAAAKAAAAEQAGTLVSTVSDAAASVTAALANGDLTAAIGHVDTINANLKRARQILKATMTGRGPRSANSLAPGQLRDKVRDHLAANPGVALSPYEVGRKLGRSSGAVANAMDRLVELGHATMESEHPRRYAAVITST